MILSIWIWMWQLFIWLQKHFNAKKAASNSNMFIWYSATEGVHSPPSFFECQKQLPSPMLMCLTELKCWGGRVGYLVWEFGHYHATTEVPLKRVGIIAFPPRNRPCLLRVRDIYPDQDGSVVKWSVLSTGKIGHQDTDNLCDLSNCGHLCF